MGAVMPHIAMLASISSGDGRVVTRKSFQRSYCGEEFDDYVFQALENSFPFSPVGASSRELPDLWKNRRFKLHYRGKWREGRVCGFRQYNPTESTMETCWQMDVQLDTIEPGDQVELKLVGVAKRTTRLHEDGTVKITTKNDGESTEYTIKPSESSDGIELATPRMKLHVHRMNVEGGGTFKFDRQNENEPLLSLEWLEPASPSVNLFEKIVTFDCPICRAKEPVMAAFEPAAKTTRAECPVCMETTKCRVLSCGHSVCEDCWGSCRLAATSVRLELEDLNESDVKKERAKRDRLFKKKRSRDGPRNDFAEKFEELVWAIARADTISGLEALRWELMVENPVLWAVEDVFKRFVDLPIEALQVILHVIESRKDQMSFMDHGRKVDYYGDAAHFCCYFIAKEFRQRHNYRGAVPWAELSVFYALHSHGGTEAANLAEAYSFTSQIYAVADMLTMSLNEFDKCARLIGGNAEENGENMAREMIRDAMKDWTGSSGKITPGI
jgi:transcription elongation factor Elf1